MAHSIADYYDARVDQYLHSYQRCGWVSPDSQYRRFWALTHHFDYRDAVVLDAGCGDGEFFKFCQSEFPDWRYVGIDVSSRMIQAARDRLPNGLFMESDLLTFTGDYDYVVCSGALNHLTPDPIGQLHCHLSNLYGMCQIATSITLLSNLSSHNSRSDRFMYYSPMEVMELALSLTPYVDINHTYADNDFCVTLFRR
ncbi:class I SAM-dependent methyltransferase [bacterium]|nr:class I SAM-dependent methyltransferase [bacterium]